MLPYERDRRHVSNEMTMMIPIGDAPTLTHDVSRRSHHDLQFVLGDDLLHLGHRRSVPQHVPDRDGNPTVDQSGTDEFDLVHRTRRHGFLYEETGRREPGDELTFDVLARGTVRRAPVSGGTTDKDGVRVRIHAERFDGLGDRGEDLTRFVGRPGERAAFEGEHGFGTGGRWVDDADDSETGAEESFESDRVAEVGRCETTGHQRGVFFRARAELGV